MKKKKNFLDYIPVKSKKINWKENENKVQLIIERDKLIDKIVRKFFNTPERNIVDLDELGSFVWQSIDGKKSVYEIYKKVKSNFGDKAEPLNERLITYINILKNNKFINIKS